MSKFKLLFLMLCLLGISAGSHANYAKPIQVEDGTPIDIIKSTNYGGPDKSSSISAYLNGSTLNVIFTENLGNVTVEIRNVFGVLMDFASLETPTGYQYFISMPGQYTVTFTLPNGDEYYGEFLVTN